MWFFLGLLIICLTIIAVFRMYLDLREGDRRHIRIVQSDAQSYDKYKRITQQEALTELTKLIDQRAIERQSMPPKEQRYAPLPNEAELQRQIGHRLDKEYEYFMTELRRKNPS